MRSRHRTNFPLCHRPWLFQTVPGSYQFAVAIEDFAQKPLFGPEIPSVEEIKQTFVSLVRESAQDPEGSLAERVPDRDYRGTFLKLTRSLPPNGNDFAVLTIRQSFTDNDPVILTQDSRKDIGVVIRQQFTKPRQSGETPGEIRGLLRAVHLDQDWIELSIEEEHKRVYEVGEAVDDVLGPLVNREVIVQIVTNSQGRILFRDIEAVV